MLQSSRRHSESNLNVDWSAALKHKEGQQQFCH